ncbi:MAG TPA: glycosyltransferase family 9 protein [Candidatus Limnocylindrales bacterium]|nr:glycosyltransferase family 9 protein [Candidatus Limnocylindrales bacterium]
MPFVAAPGRSVGRVAVFRALPGLGDLLCAVPALRALRRGFPAARIAYVGLESTRPLVERYPYVDEFVAFPGFPGLPEQPPAVGLLPGFFAALRARDFDLAIQLHGAGDVTNPIVARFGAARVAGYHRPGTEPPDPELSLPYHERCPEVRRWLRLTEMLGCPSDDERLEFPLVPPADPPEPAGVALPADVVARLEEAPFVCLHPGASAAERRWPVESFALVGDGLAGRGHRVVLTGSAGERPLTRRVAAAMRAPAIDLAGSTTLDELAALLVRAELLVCNDTGISHLAAALGVPSVVVFVASDPVRWAPLDRTRHRPVSGGPAEVLAEAIDLLEHGRPRDRRPERERPDHGRPPRRRRERSAASGPSSPAGSPTSGGERRHGRSDAA